MTLLVLLWAAATAALLALLGLVIVAQALLRRLRWPRVDRRRADLPVAHERRLAA